MGQTITSCQQDNSSNGDVLEQLNFLVNACKSKLDKYQADLTQQYVNPGKEKVEVVGKRALRWERGYRVGVSLLDEGFDVKLGEAIEFYFASGLAVEGDAKQDILQGFKKHVTITLREFFEYTLAGELEQEFFFVFVQHNSIIRIDVKFWRYNFLTNKVFANAQNAFAFLFAVSVVDHTKLSVDELTYLLSEYSGDFYVGAYARYLIHVWKQIYKLKWEVDSHKNLLGQLDSSGRPGLGYQDRALLEAPPSPPYGDDDNDESNPFKGFTQKNVSFGAARSGKAPATSGAQPTETEPPTA